MQFQVHFQEYRIVVYSGLNCDDACFDGQVESEKRINLLYDDVEHHYHVINNIIGVWQDGMSANAVTKDVREVLRTSAIRRVVTACPFLRARSQTFESLASRAIGILEVRRVLTSIR